MSLTDTSHKRLVVKVGSSTVTTSESSIDNDYIEDLARQLALLSDSGWQIVLVTSGSIACGLGLLGIEKRPSDMPTLQAAASVGQSELVGAYAEAFGRHGIITSQVLLTRRDTADRQAYLHARDTLDRLLDLRVIPIVNENDTVSVEQIRFGDNDSLAALVASLIDADLLILASDIDGLYDSDPRSDSGAKLISKVDKITPEIIGASHGAGSVAGSGGMLTKVMAARVMMAAGITMAIVNGKAPNAIVDTASGECPGTVFQINEKLHEINPKKLWIALADSTRGSITVDDGAKNALISLGKSLLCVGIIGTEGHFDEKDIVDVKDEAGIVIARGMVASSSDVIDLGMGKTSEELSKNKILSSLSETPVIHRDDLVLFE